MPRIDGKESLPSYMVSVLVVVGNDSKMISEFIHEVHATLAAYYQYYEIVLVDNGSLDGSTELIVKHLEITTNIHLIRLSNSRDSEVAITAALEHCIGDYAVLMDPYLDPPSEIPRMVSEAVKGNDVVIAHRKGGVQNGVARRLCYRFASRLLDHELNPDASYFRVLSRSVIVALNKIKHRRRYLRYFNALVGYKQKMIETPVRDIGKVHRRREGLIYSIQKATDIIISNSSAPLRWTAALGFLASLGNLAYLGYVLVVLFAKERLAEGWLTTSVMMSSMFFCMFLILTILSEYIARILEESQERPLYFIEFQKTSSVSSKQNNELINVV
jgi:polyisoprenyl-phosphate glycosyltransferase